MRQVKGGGLDFDEGETLEFTWAEAMAGGRALKVSFSIVTERYYNPYNPEGYPLFPPYNFSSSVKGEGGLFVFYIRCTVKKIRVGTSVLALISERCYHAS